ncbi:MAG: phosphate signaling complex protein PhoU [Anaerolineales bacterium]|nr:phosphate signaling complex protein PhoU [Anaerolineales bacterium]
MTTITNTRETLDRQLRKLKEDILMLGSMVETATLDAAKALKTRDTKSAQRIYENDQWINEKHLQIENDCVMLIATQQPMARDVRFLASALEVSTELERMGDYAKGIARIHLLIKDDPFTHPMTEITQMAETSTTMLHRALGAFVNNDLAAAREIPHEDDVVDELYNQFHHQLIEKMIENPAIIDRANYLLWAAHNLERLADRVTNICERTIYVNTGVLKEIGSSDDETLTKLR